MYWRLVFVTLAVAPLVGCRPMVGEASAQVTEDRFQGLGTFEVGRLWRELARPESPEDPTATRMSDDDRVIVVVDSQTGEVRQCGNMTGHCISMTPWAAAAQPAPAKLKKHLDDIIREDSEAAAREANGR